MKLISFSVWGDAPIYNYGLWENAMLLPQVFAGWRMRVYYTASAESKVIDALAELDYVECVFQQAPDCPQNMMLRFQPAFEDDVDVMISRDADSRLSQRDFMAVSEWLESDMPYHIVRDHPAHTSKMMGGIWGARGSELKSCADDFWSVYGDPANDEWGIDQWFLNEHIYPKIVNRSLIHASSNAYEDHAQCFPASAGAVEDEFVGKIIKRMPYSVAKFGIEDKSYTQPRRRFPRWKRPLID